MLVVWRCSIWIIFITTVIWTMIDLWIDMWQFILLDCPFKVHWSVCHDDFVSVQHFTVFSFNYFYILAVLFQFGLFYFWPQRWFTKKTNESITKHLTSTLVYKEDKRGGCCLEYYKSFDLTIDLQRRERSGWENNLLDQMAYEGKTWGGWS